MEVLSYNNGKVEARHAVETFGKSHSIMAHADKTSFDKKGEVAHIEITIVDEDERIVWFADTELRFRLTDNLELLGTENGSGNPADNYKDRVHRCKNGRLLLYVRSLNPAESARVTVSSPLFEDVTVNFR